MKGLMMAAVAALLLTPANGVAAPGGHEVGGEDGEPGVVTRREEGFALRLLRDGRSASGQKCGQDGSAKKLHRAD